MPDVLGGGPAPLDVGRLHGAAQVSSRHISWVPPETVILYTSTEDYSALSDLLWELVYGRFGHILLVT